MRRSHVLPLVVAGVLAPVAPAAADRPPPVPDVCAEERTRAGKERCRDALAAAQRQVRRDAPRVPRDVALRRVALFALVERGLDDDAADLAGGRWGGDHHLGSGRNVGYRMTSTRPEVLRRRLPDLITRGYRTRAARRYLTFYVRATAALVPERELLRVKEDLERRFADAFARGAFTTALAAGDARGPFLDVALRPPSTEEERRAIVDAGRAIGRHVRVRFAL